jgi:hypothetical protein
MTTQAEASANSVESKAYLSPAGDRGNLSVLSKVLDALKKDPQQGLDDDCVAQVMQAFLCVFLPAPYPCAMNFIAAWMQIIEKELIAMKKARTNAGGYVLPPPQAHVTQGTSESMRLRTAEGTPAVQPFSHFIGTDCPRAGNDSIARDRCSIPLDIPARRGRCVPIYTP